MESQDHSCQRNVYSRQIEKGEDRMEQVNPVLVPERKLSDGMVIRGSAWGHLEMTVTVPGKYQTPFTAL